MVKADQQDNTCHHRRAFFKIAILLFGAVLLIAGLGLLIDDHSLQQLKHNLSLGTIIILVIIINLVSFVCFMLMLAAYKWVRGDLKPHRQDILDEKD